MSILVVGSVAYDSVITPAARRADSLGGSAMYFSVAASRFAPVSLIAVVGEDFAEEHVALLESRGVDVSGLRRAKGSTFRWAGEYNTSDMNSRETLDTQLNVFADFAPELSAEQRRQRYLFLANIAPELQLSVIEQMDERPELIALDSMNFWIEGSRDALEAAVSGVDVLFMEESEAREFSGEGNLVRAARRILAMGPSVVAVKQGGHGALLFDGESVFSAPAFPLDDVVDPTGAGDAFAAGFMGYIAATGDMSPDGYRRATILGSVMGSFCVQDFSADKLLAISDEDIADRFRGFADLAHFPPLADGERLPVLAG